MKRQRALSAQQNSDSLGREEETEMERELAGESAKRWDSLEPTVEILQTSGEKGWTRSDLMPISNTTSGKCRK